MAQGVGPARQVDDEALVGLAENVEERLDAVAGEHDLAGQALFRGHDRQSVGHLGGSAGDEQAVDPGRVLEGLPQSAGRFLVERQGDGPEFEIQVDQGRPHAEVLGEQPAEVDRHGRGADPAPGAEDNDLARVLRHRGRRSAGADDRLLGALQRPGQGLLVHRLYQVVGHAGLGQLAVQRDVVDLADADQTGVFGESGGQRQHRAQRRVVVADVHDQHPRGRRLGKKGERIGGVTVTHDRLVIELARDRRHDLLRLDIVHEGDAVRARHGQRV